LRWLCVRRTSQSAIRSFSPDNFGS
jgi:hypothetical protein